MKTLMTESTSGCWHLSGQVADDQPVRQFPIDSSPFVVGRSPRSSLCIPSPTVSSTHAEIEIGADSLLVNDLGSTNGTFVNGIKINEPVPVSHGDLVQFAHIVLRATLNQPNRNTKTVQEDSGDRALALIQFDRLMTERAVCPHYQPIVFLDDRRLLGCEVLGRSRLFGLTTPRSMFSAAAVLNLEAELSRIFREEGLRQGSVFPEEHLLFLNTHPAEMDDMDLLVFSLRQLRDQEPRRPLVLEIHEGSATHRAQMTELRAALNDLNIELAYDDFGAGQARLVELVEVPPDYLKFDMKLVQGIGASSVERQTMLARLVQMVAELGITPLAEGIELAEDDQACQQIGFVCAQGYLYGRPALPEPQPCHA